MTLQIVSPAAWRSSSLMYGPLFSFNFWSTRHSHLKLSSMVLYIYICSVLPRPCDITTKISLGCFFFSVSSQFVVFYVFFFILYAFLYFFVSWTLLKTISDWYLYCRLDFDLLKNFYFILYSFASFFLCHSLTFYIYFVATITAAILLLLVLTTNFVVHFVLVGFVAQFFPVGVYFYEPDNVIEVGFHLLLWCSVFECYGWVEYGMWFTQNNWNTVENLWISL